MKKTTKEIIDNIDKALLSLSIIFISLYLIFIIYPKLENLEQKINQKPKSVEILCEPDPNITYNVDKLIKEYYEMKNRIQTLENNCMERNKGEIK